MDKTFPLKFGLSDNLDQINLEEQTILIFTILHWSMEALLIHQVSHVSELVIGIFEPGFAVYLETSV